AFFILIFSNSLHANPIKLWFFSELLFDSTGWKIELTQMNVRSTYDSLSLKGWYLSNGKEKAYFQDWMYLKTQWDGKDYISNYLVVTKDSLKGHLALNMTEDTVYLCSPQDNIWDKIIYGPSARIPTPKLNQSICLTFKTYLLENRVYYLDNSPTIGAKNDTLGATGTIRGFAKDAAGNPARYVSMGNYYGEMWDRGYNMTDSTGHFEYKDWLASKYTIYFFRNDNSQFPYQLFTFNLEPWEKKEMEFQLDWVVSDNNQAQDVEKKAGLGEIRYSLDQNYPNPFNPATSISYSIPKAGSVKLQVFNLLGNEVATLVNEYKNAGTHKVSFDASVLPSGVYIYTIQSGSFRNAKKMTVMK
ncbi:MAG TPA: T9SS type A sorting domain-containing protein, partial [Ignavibacteriales bacterium]|nr:T9SS type A sorting domain-containing protein [Ignavibacteriales bacterium]